MLETVRAYAALELSAAGERDDAMEGLVRYCIDESSLAAEGLVGHAQGEWLDRVRDDLENYRCALMWLIEGGRSSKHPVSSTGYSSSGSYVATPAKASSGTNGCSPFHRCRQPWNRGRWLERR